MRDNRVEINDEVISLWCGQPSDQGWLWNRTEQTFYRSKVKCSHVQVQIYVVARLLFTSGFSDHVNICKFSLIKTVTYSLNNLRLLQLITHNIVMLAPCILHCISIYLSVPVFLLPIFMGVVAIVNMMAVNSICMDA